MKKDTEKTIYTDKSKLDKLESTESSFSSTMKISRETFLGEIPTVHGAVLEVLGDKASSIVMGEEEIIIGRVPECDLHLNVENVSRQHARIQYHNEEYSVEDLGSTNGVYVNGIKINKCILRNQDIIEIGGVRIQFLEEKIRR